MGSFKINHIDATDEVLAKLMKSASAQYDCQIAYESKTNSVKSDCDDAVKPAIVSQVAAIFGVGPDS